MEATVEKLVRFSDDDDYDLWVTYNRNPRELSIDRPDNHLQLGIDLDENDLMEGGVFFYQVDEEEDGELNRWNLEVCRTAFRRGEHVTEAIRRLKEKYRLRYGGLQDADTTGFHAKVGDVVPILPLEKSAWPAPACVSLHDRALGIGAVV